MSDTDVLRDNENPTAKFARLRSPNYPALDLGTALAKVRVLHERERRGSVNARIAIRHWGYSEKSSGGQTALAALKAFGLITDNGEGPARTVQVSDLALRILLDTRPNSSERRESIQRAALSPKIHAQVWADLEGNLGSDDNLRHRLIFDYHFNENTVTAFIREFKTTLDFAEISQSDRLSVSEAEHGSDQSFVEDFSVVKLNPQNIPVRTPEMAAPLIFESKQRMMSTIQQLQPGIRQDVFSLTEGTVSIQWPESISRDSFEDLSAWLDILKRKIGRSVTTSDEIAVANGV
ncbi:MAG: hypothetical protein NTZ94_16700 [Verrucomicrobia bacterium]|nr:hypothetical protein [Verrucomicrobiota bacterium]